MGRGSRWRNYSHGGRRVDSFCRRGFSVHSLLKVGSDDSVVSYSSLSGMSLL